MNSGLSILIVDDNPFDAKLLSRLLQDTGQQITIATIYDAFELATTLQTVSPAVVFIDQNLGATTGIELIEEFILQHPQVAFVLLTGCSNDQLMAQALQLGVMECLLKDEMDSTVLSQLLSRVKSRIAEY